MYLRPAEGHELFRRITDHFSQGTIAIDTHNWLGVRLVNKRLIRAFGAPLLHWAIDDSHELERVNPTLHCTDAPSPPPAPPRCRAARGSSPG
jgi:hypothetical protein